MAEPFVGLTPYEEVQAAYFFGRTRERGVIVDNLLSYRLTLLYGESGTGKSSLLNAGVAHNLRSEPEFNIVIFKTWRDNPTLTLADAVRSATGSQSDSGSHDLVDVIRRCAKEKDTTILLLLDQFEEYFHYHSQQNDFDHQLSRILTEPDVPANVLVAIREDWLAALDRFKGRVPRLFDNYLRMQHLSRKGAEEAIEGPLNWFNEQQANGHRVAWERTLPGHVIDSILAEQTTVERGLQAEDRVQAPYLQLVMQALWNAEFKDEAFSLRAETLDTTLKGAKHIYQNHLASTLDQKLTLEQRAVALRMFRHLVTGAGRKQTRTTRELVEEAQVDAALAGITLHTLRDARILSQTPPPRGADPTEIGYEFAHDVLADGAFRLVRQESVEAERIKRKEAEARAKTEAAAARRFRYLAFSLGVLTLLVIALGAWAWKMSGDARAWAYRAEKQTAIATDERTKAERQASVNFVRELIQAAGATHLEGNFELAALLASHAMTSARSVDARLVDDAANALRYALVGIGPTIFEPTRLPLYVAIAPSGARVASIAVDQEGDGVLQVWNAGAAKAVRETKFGYDASLGWSADGRWLAAGSADDDEVKVWDDKSWKVIFDKGEAEDAVAWHPALPQLATGSTDDELVIWSMPSGRVLKRWKAHTEDITAIAWSPDGTRIATGSMDTRLRVWEVKTGRMIYEQKDVFESESPTAAAITWDEKGQRLLTSDTPRPTQIWTIDQPESRSRLADFGTSFSAWSHGGRWIVLSSLGSSVKLVDAASLSVRFQLPLPGTSLAVAWSRDDRVLLISGMVAASTGSMEGAKISLGLYDASSLNMANADLQAHAKARLKRTFTPAECKEYLPAQPCPGK